MFGNSRIFFILVLLNFHLCLVVGPQWGSTELQVGTVCFTEAQLMDESWGLPSCSKLLGTFPGTCLWVSPEGFALFWDPGAVPCYGTEHLCCSPGMGTAGGGQGKAMLSTRNTAPSHDNFQVSLFGFQPSAILEYPRDTSCSERPASGRTGALCGDSPLHAGHPPPLPSTAGIAPDPKEGTRNPWEQGKNVAWNRFVWIKLIPRNLSFHLLVENPLGPW